jgi:hypothetical protein
MIKHRFAARISFLIALAGIAFLKVKNSSSNLLANFGFQNSTALSDKKARAVSVKHAAPLRMKQANLSKQCPQISFGASDLGSSNTTSYWTVETGEGASMPAAWLWHYQTNLRKAHTTIRVPEVEPFPQISFSDAIGNPSRTRKLNISVVFYGSSHLRAVYFDMIHLARGEKYNARLEHQVMHVGSGNDRKDQSETCDPTFSQFNLGKYGIDLEGCGPPGMRLVPELSINSTNEKLNVAIGFKTFLHTPDADDLFVDFLSEHHLRHPTVLVLDVGIWGARGERVAADNKYPRTQKVLQPEEEVDYYLQWIQDTFPYSKKVYVYDVTQGEPGLEALILPRLQDIVKTKQQHDSVMIRKDIITKTKPKRLPCAHGCAGPVTNVVATLVLDWLAKATAAGPYQCIM